MANLTAGAFSGQEMHRRNCCGSGIAATCRVRTVCCVDRWCSWRSTVRTQAVSGESLRSRSPLTVCRTWTAALIPFCTRSCRSRFARTSDGCCCAGCVARCSSLAVPTRWRWRQSAEPAAMLHRRPSTAPLAINRWQPHQPSSTNKTTSPSTSKTTPPLSRRHELYIGWNDVTYLWSQYDRHFVGQDRRTLRSEVAKICRVIRIKLNQLV